MNHFDNKEIAYVLGIISNFLDKKNKDSSDIVSKGRFGEVSYSETCSSGRSINAAFKIYNHLESIFSGLDPDLDIGISINASDSSGVIYLAIYEAGKSILTESMLPEIEGFEIKFLGDRAEYRPVFGKQ